MIATFEEKALRRRKSACKCVWSDACGVMASTQALARYRNRVYDELVAFLERIEGPRQPASVELANLFISELREATQRSGPELTWTPASQLEETLFKIAYHRGGANEASKVVDGDADSAGMAGHGEGGDRSAGGTAMPSAVGTMDASASAPSHQLSRQSARKSGGAGPAPRLLVSREQEIVFGFISALLRGEITLEGDPS